MTSLWRLLALAWLGGVASPALMENPASPDVTIESRAYHSLAAIAREDTSNIHTSEPVAPIRNRHETSD